MSPPWPKFFSEDVKDSTQCLRSRHPRDIPSEHSRSGEFVIEIRNIHEIALSDPEPFALTCIEVMGKNEMKIECILFTFRVAVGPRDEFKRGDPSDRDDPNLTFRC